MDSLEHKGPVVLLVMLDLRETMVNEGLRVLVGPQDHLER